MSKEHIATLQEAIDRYRSRNYADENLVRNYGQEFAQACLSALQLSEACTGGGQANDKHIEELRDMYWCARSQLPGATEAQLETLAESWREALDAAVTALSRQRPISEDAEREHCLTVARGWGLEGDRAHALAQRLYEQRQEARGQGYDSGHLRGWMDAPARETFESAAVGELVVAVYTFCFEGKGDRHSLYELAKHVRESELPRRVVAEPGEG